MAPGRRSKCFFTSSEIFSGSMRWVPKVSTATLTDPIFGLAVPQNIAGVPAEVLDARGTWKDGAAYDTQAKKLAEMFRENIKKFGSAVSEKILAAGPEG